jgi:hypothetical protein
VLLRSRASDLDTLRAYVRQAGRQAARQEGRKAAAPQALLKSGEAIRSGACARCLSCAATCVNFASEEAAALRSRGRVRVISRFARLPD